MTERAIKAYEAYGKVTDFKNYQGLPMPTWDALPPKIKEAWVAATDCVAEMEKQREVMSFEEAWAEKEAAGYQYGQDALENVHFGWEIRDAIQKR